MLALGIESSCDDCCLALVDDKLQLLGEVSGHQHLIHNKFHGVVPELAARAHARTILPLYYQLLDTHKIKPADISMIAVTTHPGLYSSLSVGISFAAALSAALAIPCVGVDHIHAHLYAVNINAQRQIPYPHVGAVISGGHTLIGIIRDYNNFDIISRTVDDACGEAFDKVAVHLGLGYPGGGEIEQAAREGSAEAANLPDAMAGSTDISYSGLKSAVIHQLDKFWNTSYPKNINNIAASFQKKAIDMLVTRIDSAASTNNLSAVVIGGGVASNDYLRNTLKNKKEYTVHIPSKNLCTDNAAMVAAIGYRYHQGADAGASAAYQVSVNGRSIGAGESDGG